MMEEDEEYCGYSWDHTLYDENTECRECGAEVDTDED